MSTKKKTRLVLGAMATLALVAIVAGALFSGQTALGSGRTKTPTVQVKRGNVDLKVYTTGELRPARTSTLIAPPVSGSLQIVRMARTGEHVEEGDVVIEFDPSEQEYNLEQAESELLQAEQEITRSKADLAVQTAQDKVALLRAKFEVRRAELDVSRNELLSAIDGKKNELALSESKRKLAQLEQDTLNRVASSKASLVVLEERRNRARLNMMIAKRNMESMQIKAPMSGLVAVRDNQDATGGFFFSGMVLPEYRPGDTVFPGQTIAEVLEVEQMEILARVSENDRGNINPGQPIEVQVDALPGLTFSGRVKSVASMAARGGIFSASAERKFDATFQLDRLSTEIRPGVTAQVIIVGDQVRDSLYLPRQAVFDKDGKPVVYLRVGDKFEAREVKIKKRTESQAAIEGLKEGDEVALVNPEARRERPGKAPSAPVAPAGPGGGGGAEIRITR